MSESNFDGMGKWVTLGSSGWMLGICNSPNTAQNSLLPPAQDYPVLNVDVPRVRNPDLNECVD